MLLLVVATPLLPVFASVVQVVQLVTPVPSVKQEEAVMPVLAQAFSVLREEPQVTSATLTLLVPDLELVPQT